MNIPATGRDEADKVYWRTFRGSPNIITPEVLGRFMFEDYAVEISEGSGMDHQPIFGVTIVHRTKGHDYARSKMEPSLREAIAYATDPKTYHPFL